DGLACTTCDMSTRKCVHAMAVGHEAAHRCVVLLTLHVDEDREAWTHELLREIPRWATRGTYLVQRRVDDTHGHPAPVGHEQSTRHPVARYEPRTRQVRLVNPLVDEHDHTRPRVGPHLGVTQGARLLLRALRIARVVFHQSLSILRPRSRLPDQIASDRGPHDVLLGHQVKMVEIACGDQLPQREHAVVMVHIEHVHGEPPVCYELLSTASFTPETRDSSPRVVEHVSARDPFCSQGL